MRSKNASIVNHHAKTFTITVKEKPGGVYAACLGDEPFSDKKSRPRNWGREDFWGKKGWDESPDKKELWKKVLDALKDDNRYEKERNYTVNFQHSVYSQRGEELGLNREGERLEVENTMLNGLSGSKPTAISCQSGDKDITAGLAPVHDVIVRAGVFDP